MSKEKLPNEWCKNISKDDIITGLKCIDKVGIHHENEETTKALFYNETGKTYPLKYALAATILCKQKPNSNISQDDIHKFIQTYDYNTNGSPVDVFKKYDCFKIVEKSDKKDKKEKVKEDKIINDKVKTLSNILDNSKNLILRGAPGTGKTYLARQIALNIVSDGNCQDFSSDEEVEKYKDQIEFVQFHPSYDYSDFVEGLRPILNNNGEMTFELQDGIFKKFVQKARENYENSNKKDEELEKENLISKAIDDFLDDETIYDKEYTTMRGTRFNIIENDDKYIYVDIPNNSKMKNLNLKSLDIRQILESGKDFKKVKDITKFFGKKNGTQQYSYEFVIYEEIKKRMKNLKEEKISREKEKKYVFIIDEINRGEISKIFGELFFSIDPGYRGKSGEVSTQYSNLHDDYEGKFYIPKNVYIIGTMNDIDRSVDTFDFAMRRRFRFIEITDEDSQVMLEKLDESIKEEVINRMNKLNAEIKNTEGLNENYQIGAAYFLKLKELDNNFGALYSDYLKPLLKEYIQGMNDEEEIMKNFENAYNLKNSVKENVDEQTSEN